MTTYQRGGGYSSPSSRVQLSDEEQQKLIEDRIAEHSWHVQSVQALLVYAFVYMKEIKTTVNGNTYCDVDFQVVWEDTGESRKSEYIGVRVWGEEAKAVQDCRQYLMNDRGKARPVLISYAPGRITANVGMNKQGQPQAYLKADRVCIFLDLASTVVVSNREEQQQQQQEEETAAMTSTAQRTTPEVDLDTPF